MKLFREALESLPLSNAIVILAKEAKKSGDGFVVSGADFQAELRVNGGALAVRIGNEPWITIRSRNAAKKAAYYLRKKL